VAVLAAQLAVQHIEGLGSDELNAPPFDPPYPYATYLKTIAAAAAAAVLSHYKEEELDPLAQISINCYQSCGASCSSLY